MKVACPMGNVRYPDIAVHCGPFRPKDLLASEPRVVIEVLSESTKATDFLIKLKDYQSVADIQAYLIFWHDEPRVLLHRRAGNGWSSGSEILGLDAVISLEALDATLSLRHIYGELFSAE